MVKERWAFRQKTWHDLDADLMRLWDISGWIVGTKDTQRTEGMARCGHAKMCNRVNSYAAKRIAMAMLSSLAVPDLFELAPSVERREKLTAPSFRS